LTLTVLADQLDRTLPILADVARRPVFAPAELERLRAQKLDELAVSLTQPGDLADAVAAPAVFGGGAYGQVLEGTPGSLKRITRSEVEADYARAFRPDQAILVMTGDIAPETGFALAEAAFGTWRRPSEPPPAAPAVAKASTPRVIVVDLPGAGQAAVLLAGRTVSRQDPRYYAVRAVNAVLGGGYSARLNEEIRIKRGLSYGASSRIDARREAGLFFAQAQTKNGSAAEVADLMLAAAKTLSADPIPAPELRAREASLIGDYGRAIQTSAGLAAVLSSNALNGVALSEVAAYPDQIEAVDAAAAEHAAKAAVDPAAATLIIVGDAKQFAAKLKARFPTAEVIASKNLDLLSPSLVKGP
jgi:zinc protease